MPPTSGIIAHYEPFTIAFPTGEQSRAVRVPEFGDPESILSALELEPTPVIFIIGGAGFMQDESMNATRLVIADGLARFAQEHQVVIIDGGTDAGVMAMIGDARQQTHYTFPLVGVAPYLQVGYPGHAPPTQHAELNRFHSHFVLTDGNDFGAESGTIAMLTTAFSRDRRLPSLGIVINGGEIAQREAYMRSASGQMNFPLLVLEGSGRFADELAKAKQQGIVANENADQFAAILAADVQFFDVKEGADALRSRLEQYFPA